MKMSRFNAITWASSAGLRMRAHSKPQSGHRQNGAERHSLDAPAEAEHEDQVQRDVGQRGHHLDFEQPPGHPLSGEPAHHGIIEKFGRRAPDADIDIGASQGLGLGTAGEQGHGAGAQRQPGQDQHRRDCQRDHSGAGQRVHHPAPVVGPERLRGQAGDPHLQEVEDAEQQRDDGGTQRHRGQIAGLAQIADDRGVDGALQWHHGVRQHHRQGDGGDAGIGDLARGDRLVGGGHSGHGVRGRGEP
jgi:hypothetical protein